MSGVRSTEVARTLIVGLGLTLSVAGCGKPNEIEFFPLNGKDNWAFVIPEEMPIEYLIGAAIERCGDAAQCWVFGWKDAGLVPTSLPMTDAQVDSMTFSYRRNQYSGLDEVAVDCEVLERFDTVECI